MKKLKIFILLLMAFTLLDSAGIGQESNDKPPTPPQDSVSHTDKAASDRIKLFLDQETKQLSPVFPYRLNLFKEGKVDKNKAGIRISESIQQFKDLGLTGLIFYYTLYDHSMRVPHWHPNAVETGVVFNGKMRITVWKGEGKPEVFTVKKNETWLIPQGVLHILENVGEGELDFMVAYNSGVAADRDFATAWAALPDVLLEKTLDLSPHDILALKETTVNRLSSYDPEVLPQDVNISSPYAGSFHANEPIFASDLGFIRRVDANNTPSMQSMALQQTILNPGTFREPHWYPRGDVLLFVKKGRGFFTMMDSQGETYKAIIEPGDLILLPVGTFHTYVNVAAEPLEIYEVFNESKDLTEIPLLGGAQQFSAGILSSATGLNRDAVTKVLKKQPQGHIIPF